jgi:hypothetical protein
MQRNDVSVKSGGKQGFAVAVMTRTSLRTHVHGRRHGQKSKMIAVAAIE